VAFVVFVLKKARTIAAAFEMGPRDKPEGDGRVGRANETAWRIASQPG
jgi:hypothetical protein